MGKHPPRNRVETAFFLRNEKKRRADSRVVPLSYRSFLCEMNETGKEHRRRYVIHAVVPKNA
jgi:hypothetical protein